MRPEPSGRHPTGLSELDRLLGGGFPAGRISEIGGPASSGRTSLALALLAETTRGRGELTAFVDPADAFDPPSAEAAGVDLDRVLWVRADGLCPALRSVERLMQTAGLPLVLLDLGPAAPRPARSPRSAHPRSSHSASPRPASARPRSRTRRARADAELTTPTLAQWIRLARLAERTCTALVVLARERVTGSQAELALEARALRAGFGAPPHLLARVETEVRLVRTRGTPSDRALALRLEPHRPEPDP